MNAGIGVDGRNWTRSGAAFPGLPLWVQFSDLRAVQNISAFPVRADIGGQALQVRLVPGTDIAASLDHLISALLKIERHIQPKRPGGL